MDTLFWALRSLRVYERRVATLGILATLEVALRVLLPWPMKAVVDHALGTVPAPAWLLALPAPLIESRRSTLATIVALGVLLQLTHQGVLTAHSRLYARTAQQMIRDIRQRLFAHLQGLALRHHSRTPVGEAVYQLQADAAFPEGLLLRGVLPLTFSALTLLVMFGILLRIDVLLGLVSLAIVPFLFLWIRFSARRLRPGAERARQLESRMSVRMQESFAAIRLIKSFGREPYEGQRFSGAATAAMEARVGLSTREAIFSSVVGGMTVLGTSLVVLVGGLLVLEGRLTVGTLLVALAYLGFVYGPLSGIANTTGAIQQALAAAARVRATMALTPEPIDDEGLELPRPAGRVEFEHVSFGYNNRPVLQDVSFAVEAGETVALVGPSGSGKTTLLSLLPRFYEPDAGRILIDGVDTAGYSLRTVRRYIAVVLQEAIVMSGSVRENLRYGRLEATNAEIEDAARAANAHEFITALEHGYDTELAEAGGGLSGGQKARLSIARAFLKDAPILVLDEPTAALDAISERLVFSAVRRLRTGRTMFVIAHRLSTVRHADRILVLSGGTIVAQGTHDTLVHASPLYRELAAQMTEGPESSADAVL